MKNLLENDKALLWVVDTSLSHSFEVWIKIIGNSARFKGQILNPKDEDFGCWAWSFYNFENAERCFNEITSGARKITPMVEV